jgi:hypothetical protein
MGFVKSSFVYLILIPGLVINRSFANYLTLYNILSSEINCWFFYCIIFRNVFLDLIYPSLEQDNVTPMLGTPTSALQIIAEQDSLKLFSVIASSNKIHSSDLKKRSALTKKEYYSRTSQMLKAGLIKRSSGVFRLTAFGVVMYEVCLRIDAAILEYSELKQLTH